MGRYSTLFCSTFVVFALINTGAAINCYKCNGSPSEDCGSPEKHSHLAVNCSDEHNACVTEIITILNQTSEIIRGCGDTNSCGNKRSDLHNAVCTFCREDLCNSSSTLLPTLLSSLILFVLVRYFF